MGGFLNICLKYIYSIPLVVLTATMTIIIEGTILKFFISDFESSDEFRTKN